MQNESSLSKWAIKLRIDNYECTVSSLLIPASIIPQLEHRLKERGCNLKGYLNHLIRGYREIALKQRLLVDKHCKCRYQETGQNLHKYNFRPDNESWIELGQLGRANGISRCFLFVLLLLIDVENCLKKKKVEVPTNHQNQHDFWYPFFIEFSERIYPFQNKYIRILNSKRDRRKNRPLYFR